MTKSLYNIKSDFFELFKKIEECDGEITPEINQALIINEQELKEKAINYAYFIKKLDNDNSIIDAEIERLKEIKARNEAKIESLDNAIVKAMKLYAIDKVESPTLKLSLRESEAVNVLDESKLSDNFFTTKITKTVSKKAIKEALNSGAEIEGAEIIINQNLQIR